MRGGAAVDLANGTYAPLPSTGYLCGSTEVTAANAANYSYVEVAGVGAAANVGNIVYSANPVAVVADAAAGPVAVGSKAQVNGAHTTPALFGARPPVAAPPAATPDGGLAVNNAPLALYKTGAGTAADPNRHYVVSGTKAPAGNAVWVIKTVA
jgi:hypothetical protein